ncbi:hypothetical protein ACIA5G_30345 [Amycolatopsis sp. NPDC051758]|uniref:hypothetical protein n=1 Tax=Amycolatopsis sp. NPDC051758 TaxID=3363935 RepID=UPI00378D7D89
MKVLLKFGRFAVDTCVSAVAAQGVISILSPSWLPPDLRTSALSGLIAVVFALLYAAHRIAASWRAAYEVGADFSVLVGLIKQGPHRRSLFDPVDEVVLVCRNGAKRRLLEVMRVSGEDYLALAEGTVLSPGRDLPPDHLGAQTGLASGRPMDDDARPVGLGLSRLIRCPHLTTNRVRAARGSSRGRD